MSISMAFANSNAVGKGAIRSHKSAASLGASITLNIQNPSSTTSTLVADRPSTEAANAIARNVV